METLTIILIFVTALYVVQSTLVHLGTYRLRYGTRKTLPKVSVLVALRNEEAYLDECVKSLLALDYPKALIEIILINDRSTDTTGELIEIYAKASPLIRTFHVIRGIPGLSGKANAIAQAIPTSAGELILVTDGDCKVPAGWARAHVKYHSAKVGLVGGFTLLDEPGDGAGLFQKIQSLDWKFLLSIGTGAMGFGVPLSVLGNNFSFRKEAYWEVGGYRKMGFTIIEDFALMKALVRDTSWQVRYPIDPEMLVVSKPMSTFPAFFEQRKRWSAGGKEVGSYGKFLMLVACAAHLLIPLYCIFQPAAGLPALLAILAADFFLLRRTAGQIRRRDLLLYFPVWEAFYFFYTAVFAPVLLFPTTVKWKDISYSWQLNFKLKHMSGSR